MKYEYGLPVFEPGKSYPVSALTQAERDAIWSLGMRKPTRDELFIKGKLD